MTPLDLDPAAQRFLAAYARTYEASTLISEEGHEAVSFYLLVEGRVSLQLNGIEIRALETPGAFFGEVAALSRTARTFTAVAATRAVCHEIPAAACETMVRQCPDLALRFIQSLANAVVELSSFIRARPCD